MNNVPETTIYEVLFSRICSVFPMGKNVDIVGVTGSIPVTPTILFKHLAAIYEVLSRFNEPERASASVPHRATKGKGER